MFRHGVRSYIQSFPNETVPESYWDKYGGYGQLTSVGVQQMSEFGEYFAKYYEQVMDKPFKASKTFAKSTYYNRTQRSVKAFLDGMFKCKSIPIIESIPKANDTV